MPTKGNLVILTPAGGTAGSVMGGNISISSASIYTDIRQVIGLVPLLPCDESDCREEPQQQCNINPVFGNIIEGSPVMDSTYENDWNTFVIDYPIPSSINDGVINWVLEKADNKNYYTPGSDDIWDWELITVLDGTNNNGIRYVQGSIPGHPSYDGYAVNWGQVLNNYGTGFYRIKCIVGIITLQVTFPAGGVPIEIEAPEIVKCVISMPFQLWAWDCLKADGTVKFETWNTGEIGDVNKQYGIFDLCGIDWFDSIRFFAFFGFQTIPNYEETLLEYDTGYLDEIRNKALKAFVLNTKYLPKWFHDRFAVYGLMAQTSLVSDYNYSNSDYYIKRFSVKRNSDYSPKWLDGNRFDGSMRWRQRTGKVTVKFRERVESIISSICCIPKC